MRPDILTILGASFQLTVLIEVIFALGVKSVRFSRLGVSIIGPEVIDR